MLQKPGQHGGLRNWKWCSLPLGVPLLCSLRLPHTLQSRGRKEHCYPALAFKTLGLPQSQVLCLPQVLGALLEAFHHHIGSHVHVLWEYAGWTQRLQI